MTGQEMKELFFKWKGWKQMDILEDDTYSTEIDVVRREWVDHREFIQHHGLPELDLSLDLQEEWAWPELQKINVNGFVFNRITAGWRSILFRDTRYNDIGVAIGETKPLAQLEASLKALGVL